MTLTPLAVGLRRSAVLSRWMKSFSLVCTCRRLHSLHLQRCFGQKRAFHFSSFASYQQAKSAAKFSETNDADSIILDDEPEQTEADKGTNEEVTKRVLEIIDKATTYQELMKHFKGLSRLQSMDIVTKKPFSTLDALLEKTKVPLEKIHVVPDEKDIFRKMFTWSDKVTNVLPQLESVTAYQRSRGFQIHWMSADFSTYEINRVKTVPMLDTTSNKELADLKSLYGLYTMTQNVSDKLIQTVFEKRPLPASTVWLKLRYVPKIPTDQSRCRTMLWMAMVDALLYAQLRNDKHSKCIVEIQHQLIKQCLPFGNDIEMTDPMQSTVAELWKRPDSIPGDRPRRPKKRARDADDDAAPRLTLMERMRSKPPYLPSVATNVRKFYEAAGESDKQSLGACFLMLTTFLYHCKQEYAKMS